MSAKKNFTYFSFNSITSEKKDKKYNIKSEIVEDDDFDEKLEKLMSQELVYGDINYN